MRKLEPNLCAILALALTACGASQSPPPVTVTVPALPSQTATSTSTSPAPPPATTPTTARTTTTQTAPTRTAPAPAFTRTTGGTPAGGDLQAAVTKVGGLGFTPLSTAAYDPSQTLRVLVGARSGPGAARSQQAFFFDGAKYLGTDTATPSGQIVVTGHGDTDVTLRYGIYRPGDAACCPSGTPRTVHFALDGGRLVAQDPIPGLTERR